MPATAETRSGNPTPNKMGPRFGFAYKLESKTVVRGGYGIFWAPQFAIGSPIATVGYNQTTIRAPRWITTRRPLST